MKINNVNLYQEDTFDLNDNMKKLADILVCKYIKGEFSND